MLRDLLAELVGMFVGDAPLALATLAAVALTAALIEFAGIAPLLGGAFLLVSCLSILIASIVRSSRTKAAGQIR